MRSNAPLLGLPGIHSRLCVQRVVYSLGATHVILQQRHRGIPIFRAYVTVHIGRDGRMYLIKNRAVPREFLEERGRFKLAPPVPGAAPCAPSAQESGASQ